MAYSGANAVTTADRKPSLIARLEERFRYPTEGVLFAYRGRVDPRSGWQRPARRPSATPWRRRSVRLPALRCPGLAAPRAAPGSSASCPVDKSFEFLVNCSLASCQSFPRHQPLISLGSDRVLQNTIRFRVVRPQPLCMPQHARFGNGPHDGLDSQEAPRRQNAKP